MALYPSNNNSYVVNQSLASSYNGPTQTKEGFAFAFVQGVITAGSSPTGTLKLQQSADGSSWADVPSQTTAVTANGTYQYQIANSGVRYFRLVWVSTSGTGTLNAQYNLM